MKLKIRLRNFNKVITLLKNNGLSIVHKFINEDKNKWVKDSSRKLAWELYSKGLSQENSFKVQS